MIPVKWKHIREKERIIKPEFYTVVDKLISVYHCNKMQAVAGVVETANSLFERQWKFHDEDSEVIDFD